MALRLSFLEELCECPICMKLIVGSVLICERGHNICAPCRQQVTRCPFCRCNYLENARNRCLEELASGIQAIKANRLNSLQPDISTAAVSPRPELTSPEVSLVDVALPGVPLPQVSRRVLFHCPFCPNSYLAHRMHVHCQAIHKEFYKEVESTIIEPNSVSSSFIIEFRRAAGSGTRVVKIERLGLFIVDMAVGSGINYHFFLRMVATEEAARNINYKLKIKNLGPHYASKMYSYRKSARSIIMHNRCLTIERNAIKTSILVKRSGKFMLNVTVNSEAPVDQNA